MSAKSFHRRILDVTFGALLIAAGAFGLTHFQEWSFWKGSDNERSLFVSVGDLISQKGNVRYRLGHSAVWRDLGRTEQVAFGDEILTAKDGHAKIAFKVGRSAEVLPNSLVVIRPPEPQRPEAPLVEIQKGKIRLTRSAKDGETIRIAALGKVYEIAPQSGETVSGETTLEIAVPEKPSREIASEQDLIVTSDVPVAVKEVREETPAAIAASVPESEPAPPVPAPEKSAPLLLSASEPEIAKTSEIYPPSPTTRRNIIS